MRDFYRMIFFGVLVVAFQQVKAQDEPIMFAAASGVMGSEFVERVEVELIPIADGKWKYLGSCHSNSQTTGFTKYWNQVTSENGSKWGSVERVKDVMNWNDLDAAYKLAKDNGFPFKFHTLIWGNQQPSWIENLSATEQYEQIEEWYRAVAKRYPDIDQIEVVNEPIHDPPQGATNGNYIDALGGKGQTGYDWIIEAFRLAREVFPNSQLLINEYNIINNANNVTTYTKIINLLKEEGLIDGIGFQAHAFSTTATTSVLLRNLNELAKLNLPIYATELDIDGPNDQTQLNEYKRIFPIFWEHKAVHGITLWGYRPGLWRSTAYLINSDGTERPAMQWLRQYVEGALVSVGEIEMAPEIAVYPNPVSGNMVTFTGIEKITSITLFDVNGRTMKQMNNDNQTRLMMEMDVRQGVYVIKFQDDKKSYFRKVVVK